MEKEMRLAVLIDAENFSSKYVKPLFDEIAESGHASIRRIYGSWTAPQLNSWKKLMETYSIATRQECCYSVGKSSADSAMIIDAMDILYSGSVDGFCIASSDGDFTNLARRIREAGMLILGAGENKTPKAFVNSCNKFIYVDLLGSGTQSAPASAPVEEPTPAEEPAVSVGPTAMAEIEQEMVRYFESRISRGKEARAHLGMIGDHLGRKFPDFDCRNYRCKSLAQLFRRFPEFEVEEIYKAKGSRVKDIYVIYRGNGQE